MFRGSKCPVASVAGILSFIYLAPVSLLASGPDLVATTEGMPTDLNAPAPPAEDWTFQVRIAEPATALAVRQALAGAFERLGDERCAAVLEDFEDGSGVSLESRLAEVAPTPQAALERIFFYDGTNGKACKRNSETQASTEPGSRVVLVCGLRFFKKHYTNPARSEIWMIHEMLHTLGLEENPPSSHEINKAVASRCLKLE